MSQQVPKRAVSEAAKAAIPVVCLACLVLGVEDTQIAFRGIDILALFILCGAVKHKVWTKEGLSSR